MNLRGKQIITKVDGLLLAGRTHEEISEEILSATNAERMSIRRMLVRNGREDLYAILFPRPELRGCGTATSYTRGCRCEECTAANRERMGVLRRELASRPKDPSDPRHGTTAFYRNHSCRCSRCGEAHSIAIREEHQKRLARPVDPNDIRHGRLSFYTAYGCRCEPCRAAEVASRDKRRKSA